MLSPAGGGHRSSPFLELVRGGARQQTRVHVSWQAVELWQAVKLSKTRVSIQNIVQLTYLLLIGGWSLRLYLIFAIYHLGRFIALTSD